MRGVSRLPAGTGTGSRVVTLGGAYTAPMRNNGIVADGHRRLKAGEAAEAGTPDEPARSWLQRILALLPWGRPDSRLF
jgi:hypothetical protein